MSPSRGSGDPTRPGAAPPPLARALLRAMIAPDDRAPVTDELDELYRIQCGRRGRSGARRWYVRQVAGFAWRLVRHGRRRGVGAARSAFRAEVFDGRRGGGAGMGSFTNMGDFTNTGRFAIRRLGRAPMFTLVSVLTVGVGIGAFTSVFALAEAVLLERVPYEDPDRLVWVWREYVDADFPRGWLSGPDIVALREQSDVFDDVVAFRSAGVNLSGSGEAPVAVTAHYASPTFFDVLGVRPEPGRGFVPEDGFEAARPVTVISHALWVRDFGADPAVVGRTVVLDDETVEIVGVAPEDFRFVKHGSLSEPLAADLYRPLTTALSEQAPTSGAFAGLARLRLDLSDQEVEAALDGASRTVNVALVDQGATPVRLWAVGLEEDLVSSTRPALLALLASAAFLLAMLAANLTGLWMGRAAHRGREAGVRMALGAGRGGLVAGLAAESAVLALLGGLTGLALARVGIDVVVALAPENLPRLGAVDLDASVVAVAGLTTLAMAALAVVGPAAYLLRAGGAALAGGGDDRSGGGFRAARVRGALVAAQVSLSVMLLVGGGLVGRAFADLVRTDPGFDATSTLTFRVPLPGSVYDATASAAFHRALAERIESLPGVASVGATTALPLTQITNQQTISFPGAPGNVADERENDVLVDWFRATPGYFGAAGYRLLGGRDFATIDADTTTFSIVVDDVLADRFFPDGSAVGASARIFGLDATVVGVVDQARHYRVHGDDRGQVYVPFDRFPTGDMSYAVRTRVPPTSVVPAVRAGVAGLDASVPVSSVRTLDEIVAGSLGQQRLSLALIVAFALGALVLATLGIYGVAANDVVRRTREIGVRMALGADAPGVVRMVLRRGLRIAVAGMAIGLLGAVLVTRLLSSVMVGIRPGDPLVYIGVALAVVLLAQVAAFVPARRATRIDPTMALRR